MEIYIRGGITVLFPKPILSEIKLSKEILISNYLRVFEPTGPLGSAVLNVTKLVRYI